MVERPENESIGVRLEAADFPCDRLRVVKVSGRERISQLFAFDLDVAALERGAVESASMIGAPVSIVFEAGAVEVRRVHGIVSEVDDRVSGRADRRVFRLRVVPRAYRLAMVETQDVFLNLSIPEIVQAKLKLVGLEGEDVVMRLGGAYPAREFVVEYKETDLAFISRLTEHLGISFFFEHKDGNDVLVFTDQVAGFHPVEGAASAPFHSAGEQHSVFDLAAERRLVPAFYVVRDYNYRTPLVDLTSDHSLPSGYGGGVVEHGGHFKTPAEGKALAQVRAEERQATQLVYAGRSDLCAFGAGARFKLQGHPDQDALDLLLVEVEHDVAPSIGGGSEEGRMAYRNRFRAVPALQTYRPPRVTPRPRVAGLVTGIVDGGSDEARIARLDEQGRYTVRFLFDNTPPGRREASRWVRMAQQHAGENYGTHFPLRPGTEVVIGFIDGDPDRPVIVGAVPNPLKPSPIDSRSPTTHRVRTASGITIDIKD
jgi:type VI secretion system secreted protein VgrG